MRLTASALFVLGTFSAASAALAGVGLESPGQLKAFAEKGKSLGTCPLKHTEVTVDVAGFLARVTVRQRFHNPFKDKIEAIYTFPLSQNGAVDRMTMKIGDRLIEGQIKEREEARKIYERAKAEGKVASLLDQERPNIFTQAVANIEPGVAIDITISYSETLDWKDGLYRFDFPMVVGPRYVPGTPAGPDGRGFAPPTDQVPDADRITPQPTRPEVRAGHDISVTVNLNAGLPIRHLESKQHEVMVQYKGDDKSRAVVQLKDLATIPNKDFVLEYQTASERIEDAVLVHTDKRGNFFTLVLQPPKRVRKELIVPKELVFVIDKSGSMSGFPIETAKRAMRLCIEGLHPNDTFNLMTFEGGVGFCFEKPVPNTDTNRKKALDYLGSLQGGGGTEMMKAIHACLAGQDDPERLRVVCFMTDGYVGNDMAIIDAVKKNSGTARVFSFGIGTSVNRYLLDGIARAGRGEVHYILNEKQAEGAGEKFYERVRTPVLTDIKLDFGGLAVEEVFPPEVPDLFSSTPVVVKGRYRQPGKGAITLKGTTGEGPFERKIAVEFPAEAPQNEDLASLWARAKIAHLMDQDLSAAQRGKPNPAIKEEILGLGLRYRLMTQYTSFVAVEHKRITEGGRVKTVAVPVEMPQGVSYEGVFGEAAGTQMLLERQLGINGRRYSRSRRGGQAMGGGMGFGGMGGMGGGFAPAMKGKPALKPTAAAPADAPKATPKLTPRQKLAPELRDLARKLAALGTADLSVGKLRVSRGFVKVQVELTGLSEEIEAELKKLGFRVIQRVKSKNVVVGAVPVVKLEALAALDTVVRIEPAQ